MNEESKRCAVCVVCVCVFGFGIVALQHCVVEIVRFQIDINSMMA